MIICDADMHVFEKQKKERHKEQFVFLHKFIQLSLKGMLKRKV